MLLSHALKHSCVDIFLTISLLLSQAAQRVGQTPAHIASESTRPPPTSMRTQPSKARPGGAGGAAPSPGQSETAARPVCVAGYAAEYLCELTREHHFRFAALTRNLVRDTLFPPHAAAWFLLATLAFSTRTL